MREARIIAAGSSTAILSDRALAARLRGPLWGRTDLRFVIFILISLLIHGYLLYRINTTKLPPPKQMTIEQIPERLARLIIDKPIPKEAPTPKTNIKQENTTQTKKTIADETPTGPVTLPTGKAPVTEAQKSVAKRTAAAEERVRTVGVLGMLTGAGTTARGPAVVDVLSGIDNGKEHLQDLTAALDKASGLKQTASADLTSRQLVRSKDIGLANVEKIDNLVQGIKSGASEATLQKRGELVIQRPESIEGAASSSARRDNDAINQIVAANRTGIRMSYEKYLERIPGLAGKITVRFTIAASGEVSSVTVVENTTGNTDLEKEITRKIRMWQFDSIPDGDVTVTYPFIFKPS